MKLQATILAVIKKVLWTSSASPQNQRILAEAIAEKLTATTLSSANATDSSEKAWSVAKSLQAQVDIYEGALENLAQGASSDVAKDALLAVAAHQERGEGAVSAQDSPSGAPMQRTVVLADPADLQVLCVFGNGDGAEGLHRASQLVRAKLLMEQLRFE